MNLTCVNKFKFDEKLGYTHSATVNLGDREAQLFVYSHGGGVDPGEELFHYKHIKPMHISLYEMDGTLIWHKQLPDGVLPGIWWCPAVPFDMDKDGVDEIYFINNTGAPFSFMHRKLQRLNALTGEVTGSWPWSWNTFEERMSLSYRFYIVAGYAHGEPVLVTCQGTYGNMYLQGYNNDMQLRWETVIKAEDPGPRASHVTPVIDINNDGVDELFWGERLLSLDDGREIVDLAPNYKGHSDLIVPFMAKDNDDEWYIFTCREGDERPDQKRVYTFRPDGTVAWEAVDFGHMHTAWIANVKEGENGDYRKIAMTMQQVFDPNAPGFTHNVTGVFFFDAYTGEKLNYNLPYPAYHVHPIDINGDGYHEFYVMEEGHVGDIIDINGNKLAHIESDSYIRFGKIVDLPGEHIMVKNGDTVEIWADKDAVDGEIMQRRYKRPYLKFMQKLMATGYNSVGTEITCGM